MIDPRPPKFGYPRLLEEVGQIIRAAPFPEALDRRAVLFTLTRRLEVEEAVLLRRGFDKAYRQIIEGV